MGDAAPAVAATETILYRFAGGTDGFYPTGSLIVDHHGALYGTTRNGGTGGGGTVFKLHKSGGVYVKTVLHGFRDMPDGAAPRAGLLPDASGALYGTTSSGGTGSGTVFKLTPNGSRYTETIVYRFKGGTDGAMPTGTLVADGSGALYGTTYNGGGSANAGTIFKLVPTSGGFHEDVVYRFGGGNDGANPYDGDGLLFDAAADIYGTTVNGGFGGSQGTIFWLKPGPRGYTKNELWGFAGSGSPLASVISDRKSGLIGTTEFSGGNGNIYDLEDLAAGGFYSVLYTFGGSGDGLQPVARAISDGSGSLYGTTELGGNCGVGPIDNCGIVYEFTPGQTGDTILVNFNGGLDGNYPQGGLVFDPHGVLYGTTEYGGGATACAGNLGCGTVFAVEP
jgi:uncharacterized repeat protein (TIGR03803 family)